MKETYKLISIYPGVEHVPLGTQVSNLNNNTPNYFYTKTGFLPLVINPGKYPQLWEKIIEKGYEILSYYKPYKNTLNIHNHDNDLRKGLFRLEGTNMGSLEEEYDLVKAKYLIHSVKRLSDGEIFTIGDKIKYDNTITGFKIKNNSIIVISNHDSNESSLLGISKDEQPLFTTEDGVDIYEGDKYYVVEKHTFYNHEDRIAEKSTEFQNANWEINKNVCLYFSTKEKAEEYILMNKKLLSLTDIFDCLALNKEKVNRLRNLALANLNKK